MVFPFVVSVVGSTSRRLTIWSGWPSRRRCMGACLDPHHRHQLSTVRKLKMAGLTVPEDVESFLI